MVKWRYVMRLCVGDKLFIHLICSDVNVETLKNEKEVCEEKVT